jgi:hypothetical protein
MAENKTKATKLSVSAFMNAITDQTKRTDAKALVKLMQNASREEPQMWVHPSSASAAATTSTTVVAKAICRS